MPDVIERLSTVVPPGVTAPEDSAMFVWACKKLHSGNKKVIKMAKLPSNCFIFITLLSILNGTKVWN